MTNNELKHNGTIPIISKWYIGYILKNDGMNSITKQNNVIRILISIICRLFNGKHTINTTIKLIKPVVKK